MTETNQGMPPEVQGEWALRRAIILPMTEKKVPESASTDVTSSSKPPGINEVNPPRSLGGGSNPTIEREFILMRARQKSQKNASE